MASSVSSTSDLKSAALLEQMKLHLATDAVKDIINKIGLVYQLNIAPKKIGYNEEIYVVDLKKGWVTKENLHKAFGSPWSDEPAKGDPEFNVPQCYYAKQPPSLYQGYFSKFQLDTLIYTFYSIPKDEAQLYAANELYNRGWFYHREHHSWLMRVTNIEPLVKTNAYERCSYICFDPNTWETICKVTKGCISTTRWCRKLAVRSMDVYMEPVNNPKRARQDSIVTESGKLNVAFLGRGSADTVENIPLKKRKLWHQPLSSPPWTSSSDRKESLSSQSQNPSPHPGENSST